MYKAVLPFESMKAIEQLFPLFSLITLYSVAVTFGCGDKIVKCNH